MAKELKLKATKFWGPNPTFVEVTGEKLVGGPFCPPILNRVTYIQPPLKRDHPDRVIIHVDTNDLRSSQDPETIAKNITYIAKNNTTNKNEILVLSIVLRRDNLNGKGVR